MVLILIPLLEILAALVSAALCVLAVPLANATAEWLESIVHRVPFVGGKVSDWARNFARWLTHNLGAWFNAKSHRLTRWVGGLSHYAAVTAFYALAWPLELLRLEEWLRHRVIPDAIDARIGEVARKARGASKTVAKQLAPSLADVRRLVRQAIAAIPVAVPWPLQPYLPSLRWLRRHQKGLAAAIAGAGAITLPWGGAGRLERKVAGQAKRLGRLEKITAGLGVVALIFSALRRLGWKCMPGRKTGRAVCGLESLDAGLLESLLADAVAVLSITSVVEFAKALQVVEDEAVGVLGHLIREFPDEPAAAAPYAGPH